MLLKLIHWLPARFIFMFWMLYSKLLGREPAVMMVFSQVMQKNIPSVVFVPEGYELSEKRYPVLYLLHGYNGSCYSWSWLHREMRAFVEANQCILVCPDGARSWYIDAPRKPRSKFETFISQELVRAVDLEYRTIKQNSKRVIAGISMGGHGAVYLALRHPDIFGAVASTSGGLDLKPFAGEWNLNTLLGNPQKFPGHWIQFSAIHQLDSLKEGDLGIYLDCGTDDFFLLVNRSFHDRLTQMKISHQYFESEGGHDQKYWLKSMQSVFLFMSSFLQQQSVEE